ncbi:hypothetical protein THF5H11_10624 [Vibrio jasicida]|nr:hypothetical protein THF5H11_10624 [Vibrio jasicida]CAH1602157.1 hypothetical protein THF1C08_80033 [Vibrio jasicida]CAH1609303.1 hypothetical protein THF5G08_90037 [Vibrio jasicida]
MGSYLIKQKNSPICSSNSILIHPDTKSIQKGISTVHNRDKPLGTTKGGGLFLKCIKKARKN